MTRARPVRVLDPGSYRLEPGRVFPFSDYGPVPGTLVASDDGAYWYHFRAEQLEAAR